MAMWMERSAWKLETSPTLVHTVIECTNVARSQVHPSHAQTPQFVSNLDVLSVRGQTLGLVHGDLNLERTPRHRSLQVTVEVHHMGDCPAGQDGDHDEPR
jgi:hypothetical protein